MPGVSKKPKELPLEGFGAYLAALRGKRSRTQILIKLADLGIVCSESAFHRYEKGQRDSPDPLVLWGLAQIYKTDLERLILALHANLEARRKGESFGLSEVEAVLHRTTSPKKPRGSHGAETDLAWQRVAALSSELFELSSARTTPEPAGQTPTTRRKKSVGTQHRRVSGG